MPEQHEVQPGEQPKLQPEQPVVPEQPEVQPEQAVVPEQHEVQPGEQPKLQPEQPVVPEQPEVQPEQPVVPEQHEAQPGEQPKLHLTREQAEVLQALAQQGLQQAEQPKLHLTPEQAEVLQALAQQGLHGSAQPEVSEQPPLQLSSEQRDRLSSLRAQMANHQGNKGRIRWDKADKCFACKRPKHSCKWSVRERHGLTGSWCYCCTFAADRLRVTKNQSVLLACPDVLSLLKQRSEQKSADLSKKKDDICQCDGCSRKRKPAKRLRCKTRL